MVMSHDVIQCVNVFYVIMVAKMLYSLYSCN